ncbi:MAG: methyltransferase [Bacteroidota bacterium]
MNKIRLYIPLVITVIGGFVIGILAMLKLWAEPFGASKILACMVVIIYFLWKILESKITVSETTKGENNDKGTVEMCAAVEIGLLVSVFAYSKNVWLPSAIAGLILIATGLLIRFAAIAALDDGYSLRIREIKNKVVKAGPYRLIRHPSYLGTVIVHTGLVFVFPGILPMILLVAWYAAVFVRAATEDKFLMKNKDYKIYSKQTSRMLFPGLY